MTATRFSPDERRLLLTTPGIGRLVVDRLEAAGFGSLRCLCEAGAERVVEQAGSGTWLNRRRALVRAIQRATDSNRTHAVPS